MIRGVVRLSVCLWSLPRLLKLRIAMRPVNVDGGFFDCMLNILGFAAVGGVALEILTYCIVARLRDF